MARDYGYTKNCGMCFGDLSSCVVAHCLGSGNCAIAPNGEACKTCTDQHCTPAFNTCTGFDVPTETLAAPLTQCGASDMTYWKSTGQAAFKTQEKHCAMQCGGQNPCTGDCMARDYGYTKNCGMCFGDLSSCVVAHCLGSGNCAIAPNGQACKTCTDQHCTPAFNTCTGFDVPTASSRLTKMETKTLEVAANMCCADGCGTDGWYNWSTKAKYCPMACGYCYQAFF